MYDIFKLLANVKKQQVEDFFIDYLVNDEKIRPEITRIVNNYFATPAKNQKTEIGGRKL